MSSPNENPPAYNAPQGQQGYQPPPQQGYPLQQWQPPPQQGYPPPQQGYLPQQGYPPLQQGYPPTQQGYPPQAPVFVVSSQQQQAPVQPIVTTQVTVTQEAGVNHCLHCCISIFFFPWIFVWMILCCCYGC